MGEKGAKLFMNNAENGNVDQMNVGAYDFANFEGKKLTDTTGAGDAFTAVFALGLIENADKESAEKYKAAIKLGCQSAFLCICRYGAGPAMPMR